MANRISDALVSSTGYEQITDASAVSSLTPPAGTRYALVQCLDQNIRWRDDGTDPTATVGMVLAAGESLFYNGSLSNFRFIEAAAGAEVNVTYYS